MPRRQESAVDELLNHFAELAVELKHYGSLSAMTKAAQDARDAALAQQKEAEDALKAARATAANLHTTSNVELIEGRRKIEETLKNAQAREALITERAQKSADAILAKADQQIEAKTRELDKLQKDIAAAQREHDAA